MYGARSAVRQATRRGRREIRSCISRLPIPPAGSSRCLGGGGSPSGVLHSLYPRSSGRAGRSWVEDRVTPVSFCCSDAQDALRGPLDRRFSRPLATAASIVDAPWHPPAPPTRTGQGAGVSRWRAQTGRSPGTTAVGEGGEGNLPWVPASPRRRRHRHARQETCGWLGQAREGVYAPAGSAEAHTPPRLGIVPLGQSDLAYDGGLPSFGSARLDASCSSFSQMAP
jgi:hypothetical protein